MCSENYILTTCALSSRRVVAHALNSGFITRGCTQPGIYWKVWIPSGVFGVASFGLICISSESCLGSIVGFARLLCLLPYVPFYRLRRPRHNYCDCALVHPDKHLSRKSQKLTVMIKRETGQPLDDLAESSRFLCINEGPVSQPRMYAHRIRRRMYQGLYSSPTVKLLWLSESVKAI